MNILIVGGGGREHAIAWRLAQDSCGPTLFCAPGNAGTAALAQNLPISAEDVPELLAWAKEHRPDLTVVGPEVALCLGLTDAFNAAGLRVFGPCLAAARMEGSKLFSKEIMAAAGVPTARSASFDDAAAAVAALDGFALPVVIKADGLAAGKGVIIAQTRAEAADAVRSMLVDAVFGAAGAQVLIEEFLEGEEASILALVDGERAVILPSSQDHKRIFDGDQGPNTGGMGAYSPAPCVTPEVHAKAMREIILPTVRGMAADGIPFTGFLYAGLMIGKDGSVKTLEFNCRMGDPETQPILMRLKSDFVDLLEHGIDGTLDQVEAEWDRRIALGVVLAAANYPDTPQKGDVIGGLPKANSFGDDCHVFHAGTANQDSKVVTNGGRVLCVTALGENVKLAQKRAYEAVAQIGWEGMQFRKDIGHRALNR